MQKRRAVHSRGVGARLVTTFGVPPEGQGSGASVTLIALLDQKPPRTPGLHRFKVRVPRKS